MKNLSQQADYPVSTTLSVQPVSLYNMVNRLQSCLLPQAVDKRSFIINDVDKDLSLNTDENILAYVVGSILGNAVSSTSNSCIRVETIRDENGFRLSVRNNGTFTYSSSMHSLGTILYAARQIGGGIALQSEAGGRLTVVFLYTINE